MLFLVKGTLPWNHIEASSIKEANEEVLRLKTERRGELLAGLPPAFQELLGSLEELKFNSVPDYARLREIITSLMKKNGYENDYKYDWEFL